MRITIKGHKEKSSLKYLWRKILTGEEDGGMDHTYI
jgi:hypothetical protein